MSLSIPRLGRPRNRSGRFIQRRGEGKKKKTEKRENGYAIAVTWPRFNAELSLDDSVYRAGPARRRRRKKYIYTVQDTPATFLSTALRTSWMRARNQPPANGRMVVNLSYEACVGSADNRPPLSSVSSTYIYKYNVYKYIIFVSWKYSGFSIFSREIKIFFKRTIIIIRIFDSI